MPYIEPVATTGKKRKRDAKASAAEPKAIEEDNAQARILLLETQIPESRQHYNNIATLLTILKGRGDASDEASSLAAVALCRVYCRLMAGGNLSEGKGISETERVITQWLKERYREYTEVILGLLRGGDSEEYGSTCLTLLMRLVKEETVHLSGESAWKSSGPFERVVFSVLDADNDAVREEFVDKFVNRYADIRFYTFQAISAFLHGERVGETNHDTAAARCLAILSAIEGVPSSKADLEEFHGEAPKQSKHHLYSVSAHKRRAQEAWMALLRCGLNKEQRKAVLGIMTQRVVPWFVKVELLMDFLTDSYNVGGATSLLALSGLFYLIQEKNLDYPSFYQKLYSLLDSTLLYSKHRSRFFRLLDTFMSSTHLPAALVASFIKRLARLALHGPPAGIVVVVPWVYNMLKRHKTCTFMIHREVRDPEALGELEDEGMDDPFDMQEEDPMETGALESSLWEVETLQSHYHPNVATLAKIISEQFTKESYNLEDFLDHSYTGLLEAELGRELKKAPVVEYEIPKRIFTESDTELGLLGNLMAKVLESEDS